MDGSTIYSVSFAKNYSIKPGLGSGRNPRRQHKKEKAKELAYMRYGGYDSSEEFNSSPYVR